MRALREKTLLSQELLVAQLTMFEVIPRLSPRMKLLQKYQRNGGAMERLEVQMAPIPRFFVVVCEVAPATASGSKGCFNPYEVAVDVNRSMR
jgi:hypothetical protein